MARYTHTNLISRLMALQEDLEDLDDIACHQTLSDDDVVYFTVRIGELMATVDDLLDRAFEYSDPVASED